ncbi:aldehyde dehydrogenase family protein [Gulosibacter faecalis]|uniref:Aldehyde dehydrogenase n=1 Tax=Gulosibacter faecalis TaxID=272240 RepID=A0ABW5UTX2_9MICO|nr:aldehyde dehydrogenase family protein [Gulosibacter faecalis]
MTTTETQATFDVRNPATGEVVGTYPRTTRDEVDATVARARAAAAWWSQLSYRDRAERLGAFRGAIARNFTDLTRVVHEETGKPTGEAALEIALILDHVAWAAKHARRVLGPQRRGSSLMSFHLGATVEYRPLGVVGVIGPWNFPVMTPLGSIAFALAAGNTVVFKPSEFTPGVGVWLAERFAEAVPEHPVLQVITGEGATGDALARSAIDKLAFTGSTRTAKRVMAAAAERLTPVVAECGGKDAFVVDYDADLDAAAEAAAWTSLANAGQICVGTERLYVHSSVYDEFAEKLAGIVNGVRAGAGGQLGPLTMPSQLEVVGRHVSEALAAGGRVRAGAVGEPDGQFVQPVVLEGVPESAAAVREETFGPTVTLAKFDDVDEVLRLVNATDYGLGGTVFGKRRANEIAAGMRSGMVSVNVALGFAQVPSTPFGGVGASGFGRIHGPEGLREFAYAHSVVRKRLPAPANFTSFGRTPRQDALLERFVHLMHDRAGRG